jgi:hypothetical protein
MTTISGDGRTGSGVGGGLYEFFDIFLWQIIRFSI